MNCVQNDMAATPGHVILNGVQRSHVILNGAPWSQVILSVAKRSEESSHSARFMDSSLRSE